MRAYNKNNQLLDPFALLHVGNEWKNWIQLLIVPLEIGLTTGQERLPRVAE